MEVIQMRTAIIILAAVLAISMPTPSYSQNNTPGPDEIPGTFVEMSDDMKIIYIEMIVRDDSFALHFVEMLYNEDPDIRNFSKDIFNIILDTADDKLRYNIGRLSDNDPLNLFT